MNCVAYAVLPYLFAMTVQPTLLHTGFRENWGWMHKIAVTNQRVSYKQQAVRCMIDVMGK
jgi:hypothetical protein